jgi:tetratricopeptide (TPR) repeat protein
MSHSTYFSALFFGLTFFVLAPLSMANEKGDDYQEALVAYKSGQYDQALERVDALLVKSVLPRGFELKGRILHAQGKYLEAETTYFSALEKDPELHSVHYYLGEAAFKRKSWSEGIQYFRVHLAKVPGSKDSILKMIYCYLATGHFPEAGRWITALDPVDEFSPAYYFARAAISYATDKHKEYAEILQQSRTIYSNEIFNQYEPDLLFLLKSLPKPEATQPVAENPQ